MRSSNFDALKKNAIILLYKIDIYLKNLGPITSVRFGDLLGSKFIHQPRGIACSREGGSTMPCVPGPRLAMSRQKSNTLIGCLFLYF
jgi:hypothetical protein